MSDMGDELIESLKKFNECEHTHWECCGCRCRTDEGGVAWRYRRKINDLEAELEKQIKRYERLKRECQNLKESGIGLIRMFNEAIDQRDAAREIAIHFAECMRNGNRPEWSKCVEKYPWLKPES